MPGSMPNVAEVDELLDHSARIEESLRRIRDVVVTHQVAMAEQAQDLRCRPGSYESGDPNSFNDDSKGAGGFAGPDSKKRRGVSSFSQYIKIVVEQVLIIVSELHRLVGVTAAIVQKRQSGAVALMAHALSAMRAVFVSLT